MVLRKQAKPHDVHKIYCNLVSRVHPFGHRERFAIMCSPLHGTIVLEDDAKLVPLVNTSKTRS